MEEIGKQIYNSVCLVGACNLLYEILDIPLRLSVEVWITILTRERPLRQREKQIL